MPTCRHCNSYFPNWMNIEGKRKSLQRRKFCIDCSPYGGRNTRKDISTPKIVRGRKRRFTCNKCGKERNETSGNLTCGTCRSLARRHEAKDRARKLLGAACSSCGYSKCQDALEFHHKIKETKSFNLSACWQFPWSKLHTEILKCVLLCANCHREHHSKSG